MPTCVFEEVQLSVKGGHLVKNSKLLVPIVFHNRMQFLEAEIVN